MEDEQTEEQPGRRFAAVRQTIGGTRATVVASYGHLSLAMTKP
jgi:hypothetical protein